MGAKNIKKVSVVTTFYGAEQFILNAINSIFQQQIDGFNLEYIIVDDKSKDKSRAIVEQFIKDNKIHTSGNYSVIWKIVEPEHNLGCGGARKFGIEQVTGDYVMFLDADDYYMHTDFIKRAVHDIESEKADIVEYGVIFNQGDGRQSNNTASEKIVLTDTTAAELALFKDNNIKFNVWSKIYTKAIIDSYPYSTAKTFEDVRTTPIWVSNAKKIVIMPTPEVNYRAAGGSIIRTNMIDTRLGTISAIAELFDKFKDDFRILKAMYGRAMVDLEALLHNHSSNDAGFNEMSRLNTKMLSYIYPDTYKNITFHIEDEQKENSQSNQNNEQPFAKIEELVIKDSLSEEKSKKKTKKKK